jgi:hypothetical protein
MEFDRFIMSNLVEGGRDAGESVNGCPDYLYQRCGIALSGTNSDGSDLCAC